MKIRVLSLIMAVLLLFGTFAIAETTAPVIDPTDPTIIVGKRSYTLPLSVSELTEMGVTIPDLTDWKGGVVTPVSVHDGRNGFYLYFVDFEGTPGEYWAVGCKLNAEEHAGVSICGMTPGKTTLSEVVEALGPDHSGNTSGDSLTYYLCGTNHIFLLTFDDSSVLSEISMHTNTLTEYGPVKTAEPAAEELPDPAAMSFDSIIVEGVHYRAGDAVQKLLDNGWHLPVSVDPNGSVEASTILSEFDLLFNGKTFIRVYYKNTGDKDCAVRDCMIKALEADSDFGVEIIAADGIQPGVSTLADAKATFGEPAESSEKDNGTEYTFSVLNNTVHYYISVDAGDVITAIRIGGLA